jgi:type III pantothenate kinase
MKRPNLLIDVSNSWTKVALGRGSRVHKILSCPTPQLSSSLIKEWRNTHQPAHTIVSSVVPSRTTLLRRALPRQEITFLDSSVPLSIRIRYPNPASIGADRLANSLAAAELYPLPAVVIDFGTAVTFDIISVHREYLGGVIAPGLNAMTDYLHEKTALLPRIHLRQPRRSIAKSTVEAMQVGAVIGYRGLIREILHSIRQELKTKKLSVIATGGHASLIARSMPEVSHINPLLTLQGLQFARLHHLKIKPHPF